MKKIKVNEKFKRTLYSVTAFTLCLVALFSFWLANRNNDDFIPENPDTVSQKEITTKKDVQVNTPVQNVPDDRYEEITTEAPITVSVEFVFPLNGSVSKTFSRDELVKNVTTGDWRIHKGIDIKGASGDRVNSVYDGTVTEIVDSALWGTVVTVDHDNGFVAKYCGLRKDSTVKPGDEIKAGEKIGLLDEIPLEKDDGIHLHFELYKDGKTISPSEYLGKKVDIS
ncbi:MAG: M23 family metallopeptidase [Clostridia bacterium]|nr:M23 family metallopeptidase [Clostridia bacterium]